MKKKARIIFMSESFVCCGGRKWAGDIKGSRGANWKRISVLKREKHECCCFSFRRTNKEIIPHYCDQLRVEMNGRTATDGEVYVEQRGAIFGCSHNYSFDRAGSFVFWVRDIKFLLTLLRRFFSTSSVSSLRYCCCAVNQADARLSSR